MLKPPYPYRSLSFYVQNFGGISTPKVKTSFVNSPLCIFIAGLFWSKFRLKKGRFKLAWILKFIKLLSSTESKQLACGFLEKKKEYSDANNSSARIWAGEHNVGQNCDRWIRIADTFFIFTDRGSPLHFYFYGSDRFQMDRDHDPAQHWVRIRISAGFQKDLSRNVVGSSRIPTVMYQDSS